jgi:hypothetical protein
MRSPLGFWHSIREFTARLAREMSVSDRVREIEKAIDTEIRELKIWRRSRAAVLADLMHTYRDAIEVVFLELLFFQTHAATLDVSASDVGSFFAQENRLRAGILWSLKWASEFCPENGSSDISTPDELTNLVFLGADYETFVDVLKYANHELVDIKIDEQSRTLICYEGRQATGFDAAIVLQQRITNPRAQQVSLTEDGDQITSRWVAGDYRRVIRDLASYAASKENVICMDPAYLAQLGMADVSIPQPTLIWIDRPSRPPDCHVFEDLVLQTVIDSALKWKLVALLDTPIVKVGQYCALSSDIKALSQIDDHMLRLAARVDERQYTIAASLRENRMIKICKDAFEQCSPSWSVRDRVHFSDPTQQADLVATRGSESLVLELKSTLRPETPWETYKRNDDIIHGIKQAKALSDRGVATYSFVITDGYRGDYVCWAEALSSATTIGTLTDLVEITSDPATAVPTLQAKVGITRNSVPPHERLPDRETTVTSWKLRLVDMEAPQN